MNIVIKEAEEKHVIFCVNILQNTGLGTIYFSNYQKAADLLLHALAQRELFVALNEHGDCLGFMYFMPKGVFGSYPYLHIRNRLLAMLDDALFNNPDGEVFVL